MLCPFLALAGMERGHASWGACLELLASMALVGVVRMNRMEFIDAKDMH